MVIFYRNVGRNLWKRNRPDLGMFVHYTACGQMCPVENTESFCFFVFISKKISYCSKKEGYFPSFCNVFYFPKTFFMKSCVLTTSSLRRAIRKLLRCVEKMIALAAETARSSRVSQPET